MNEYENKGWIVLKNVFISYFRFQFAGAIIICGTTFIQFTELFPVK